MIVHVFNASVVSGPETLAIPALKNLGERVEIFFLLETRVEKGAREVVEYMERHGYRVHVIPVRSRLDRGAITELRRLTRELKPRVLHAHDTKASFYVWRACRGRRAFGFPLKLVSTHHGAAFRKGIIRLYEEIYVRLCLNAFDHVLCMCESDRQSLLRRGVRPGKILIHTNGVDRPKVTEAERTETQKRIRASWAETDARLKAVGTLGASKGALWLGAVARLSAEKRHDRMLRVLAGLKERGVEAVLLCFGRGAEQERLQALTRELGLEAQTFWMGYRGTIGQELAGFDLTLCLSDGEGIPINLLESAWAGTPVLSTRVGGIPDFIRDPETGFLVEPSENDGEIAAKLAEWARTPEELRRRGLAFQADVEKNFSEKSWLGTLRRVYG